jgi:hypothetical protein
VAASLKGLNVIAQGNALGNGRTKNHEALRGRNTIHDSARNRIPPFQGFNNHVGPQPRPSAWAITSRPCRAGFDCGQAIAPPKFAVTFPERQDAPSLHVVDALLDCEYFLFATAQRSKCVAQNLIRRRVRSAGEPPLDFIPNIGR